eukprot:sb/3470295/
MEKKTKTAMGMGGEDSDNYSENLTRDLKNLLDGDEGYIIEEVLKSIESSSAQEEEEERYNNEADFDNSVDGDHNNPSSNEISNIPGSNPHHPILKILYDPGSDAKANERYNNGAWPMRGRSGETIRESNKVSRLLIDYENQIAGDIRLSDDEKAMRIEAFQKLVFETVFGGDRSRKKLEKTGKSNSLPKITAPPGGRRITVTLVLGLP